MHIKNRGWVSFLENILSVGGKALSKTGQMGSSCLSHPDWNQSYRTSNGPPWDIGRPQPTFIGLVKNHEMIPPATILDVGCGTGENAIFFAQSKFTVSGLDISREAIDQARSKAKERSVKVDFREGNALALEFKAGSFDHVADSGLFHTFDDAQRPVFRDEIARILNPKGVYFMMCFSDKEPTNWGGPRRVSKEEIIKTFSTRFKINYIRDELFTTKIHNKGGQAYLTSATRI